MEELNVCGPEELWDRLAVLAWRDSVDCPVNVDDLPRLLPDEGVAVEDVASTLAPAVNHAVHAHE